MMISTWLWSCILHIIGTWTGPAGLAMAGPFSAEAIYCNKGIVITTDSLLFQIQMSEHNLSRTTWHSFPHSQGYSSWYRSLQYVTYMSCNVVVLRHIILYCNIGRCVKDGVVHHSRQQSLVAKWLGFGLGVGREWDYFFFFFLCVKWQRHLCCFLSTLTVRHSQRKDNSTWHNDDVF